MQVTCVDVGDVGVDAGDVCLGDVCVDVGDVCGCK